MYEFSKCSNCYILYLHSLGIEASSGKSTWNKYCAIRYYFKINKCPEIEISRKYYFKFKHCNWLGASI